MPTITIDGVPLEFEPGQNILEVALGHEMEIPHYCWHPSLSVVASCRICLAEVWAPNPRNDNVLEPIPKLLPTCQTPAADGQVVYTGSPKAIANQKAVMELLLINHPVDCPVCDQAGECHLQDYAYQYGRSVARFAEEKIKQPKKDLGPHVLLYADRCIMCTRCVRFTREITGTSELIVEGRGALEQIDVFPGIALDNELSANVIDLCPVGALLDKDFLFQQRVWFLTSTPSIDGITASGDNIFIEHNDDRVYRIKPRVNLDVNRYWITDEVRYGWRFVHDEARLALPRIAGEDAFEMPEAARAWESASRVVTERLGAANHVGLLVSPMLTCEEAYLLGLYATQLDPDAVVGIGPVPVDGVDRTFKDGFRTCAEKAPNARGVRRVLERLVDRVHDFESWTKAVGGDPGVNGLVVTGNYPSDWITPALRDAVQGSFVVLVDTLENALVDAADVVLPSATWAEKAGTFENRDGRLQAFERAIAPLDYAKGEGQIALDLIAAHAGATPTSFDAARTRQAMADAQGLTEMVDDVHVATARRVVESDMELVEL